MAEISLTFSTNIALRIKSAYINIFDLDENINNAAILEVIKADLTNRIKQIVKAAEKKTAFIGIEEQIDSDVENEVIIE